ncbi:MAG: RluA family pseudouridine synthase [Phycisphaerales bacterium]
MLARLAGVRVIHQAADWLALDKPAGVLSVPGKGEVGAISVVSWVKERYPHATGPLTVHRLDMDTSGLLLVGLTPESQRSLSMLFEARGVEKSYVAVVAGRVGQASGVFDAPMRLDVPNRPRQVIDFEQGKPARTEFRVLAAEDDRTRLKLVPLTGRTHQLRLHCAHAGHPIFGDIIYGDRTSAPRLLLHAERLAFADPGSGQPITIESLAPF